MTLRSVSGLPSLRSSRIFDAIMSALAAASHGAFRVLHFSVQRDHVHLLVEADEPRSFTSGIQGLVIRAARGCNRALGRHGVVWADRYHARRLATPREVRNALVYVLANVKKHVPVHGEWIRDRRGDGSTAGGERWRWRPEDRRS